MNHFEFNIFDNSFGIIGPSFMSGENNYETIRINIAMEEFTMGYSEEEIAKHIVDTFEESHIDELIRNNDFHTIFKYSIDYVRGESRRSFEISRAAEEERARLHAEFIAQSRQRDLEPESDADFFIFEEDEEVPEVFWDYKEVPE